MVVMLSVRCSSRLEHARRFAEQVMQALLERGQFAVDAHGKLCFRVDGRLLRVNRRSTSEFGKFVSATLGISIRQPQIAQALDVVLGVAEEQRVAALAQAQAEEEDAVDENVAELLSDPTVSVAWRIQTSNDRA